MKSPVWGNTEREVSQGHGVNLPNVPDEWYRYATEWGLPYGHHPGLDISMECGTDIYAIAAGTVTSVDFTNSFRPYPVHIITDDGRYEHIYGHLQSNVVRKGQRVTAGQYLGKSGRQTVRGSATEPDGSGCHLHFELRDLQTHQALDPTGLLTGSDVVPQGGGAPWPTAAAINSRIEKSEAANGSISPLHGLGQHFLDMGKQYGINPAVVVAISQRECQLGAATNDAIVPFNNFGGNTCGAVGVTIGTGCRSAAGREWETFASPRDGVEAIYQTLNADLYRKTGGAFGAVMEVYSPRFENDWNDMWAIFAEVGTDLGVPLNESFNIYGGSGTAAPGGGGGLLDLSPLLDQLTDYGKRTGLGLAGVAAIVLGVVVIVGPDKLIPAGRLARAAKAAAT